ncbi:hypothetical protein B7494_g4182 [Chlorociboria aeruginascens]|nr:hypothetical protein B7494_g4182 [Chlorociboria aeruginascens]
MENEDCHTCHIFLNNLPRIGPSDMILFLICYGSIPHPSQPSRSDTSLKEYQSAPNYEYSSLYRLNADWDFENALENRLLNLEHSIRDALPKNLQDLKANRTIWQMQDIEQASTWASWVSQWRVINPYWTHRLYTPSAELLLPFIAIPEINDTFTSYPLLQSDLTRYLLLWYYGGIYAEIDTWPRVALNSCLPLVNIIEGYRNISLTIGVDIDEPYWTPETVQERGWSRGFGFGQVVLWAQKRFDPIIRRAIVRTVSSARKIGHTRWSTINIGEVSGGSMFTDAVFDTLSENLKEDHFIRDRDAGLERRVTWKKFRALKKPIWIEPDDAAEGTEENMRGLAVLPINVWGNGQGHSGAGSFDHEDACVNHVLGKKSPKTWHETFFG